mgnify:CR=1 FL=1
MNKLVSILVPTKDRPQFVRNIINNFKRQDYGLSNMELIIMGNVLFIKN